MVLAAGFTIAGVWAALIACGITAARLGHWPSPKKHPLAEAGPYAYVRNPLYLGTLLVAVGLVIASRRWLLAALFGAVFVLIYLPVIELEEQHLTKLFPNFAAYAAGAAALACVAAGEI